jgi:general secretion pathway protein G
MMIAPNPPTAGCRHRVRRTDGNEAGFTLVEVLIVLAIVALLATVITPQVLRYFGQAKTDTARIQLSAISSALELYVLDNGSYPSQQAGLSALVRPPADAPRWQGPYLKKTGGLVDPWGRPYQYRIPGRQSPYEIFSLGRDNAVGGTGEDQDIVNW